MAQQFHLVKYLGYYLTSTPSLIDGVPAIRPNRIKQMKDPLNTKFQLH